jgi:hypothetical protein
LIQNGEIRPNTPVIFGIEENEGDIFMSVANPLVKTPSKYIEMFEKVYGDTAEEILSIYPPPCMDDTDPECSCYTVASQWLTGMFNIYYRPVTVVDLT